MKSFGFVSCFIVLLALVLVSYAERTYPLPAHNQQDVEAQKWNGTGSWGGWSAAARLHGHPRIAISCEYQRAVTIIGVDTPWRRYFDGGFLSAEGVTANRGGAVSVGDATKGGCSTTEGVTSNRGGAVSGGGAAPRGDAAPEDVQRSEEAIGGATMTEGCDGRRAGGRCDG
ncbi:hypothetical protein R6Q59_014615 [Mikania micrantha]